MPIEWRVENIEQTEGSNISNVAWRATGDAGATAYGVVGIEDLTLNASTTEEHVIQLVKASLNAFGHKLDENGNPIPPKPGEETARTDAIEAGLRQRAQEAQNPGQRDVPLPWAAPAPAPAPAPGNEKSGVK